MGKSNDKASVIVQSEPDATAAGACGGEIMEMRTSQEREPLPFKRGDRVIDDNGETGTIFETGSAQWDAQGKLEEYSFRMRYDWDMDSYGKERSVSKGEFSLLLPICETHKWKRQRVGGDPAEAGSNEVVEYCEECGLENTED